MREIKFRAWDNERKIFVPDGSIVFNFYGETYIDVVPNCLEYVGDSCHNGEPQRGRFSISQYTGLKDKNGKEIYEGDIVKGVWSGKTTDREIFGVVDFKEGMFGLENSIDGESYTINRVFVSVIGNIYENPELIEHSVGMRN